ncbi:hypothetical protein C8R44DRAFT_440297 [Mycena epipterygia]|nr:hypothetical protein C8R44DRAFT_440297 [Mycena epipterygia]
MLAMHVRRGDYEKHCRYLASVSAPFYGWNALPLLLDAYVPEPDAADKEERFLARCWPDVAGIVATAGAARRDYAAHVNAHGNGNGTQEALDVFYLLTNDNSAWLGEVKRALRKDGWAVVATSRDLVLDAEQKDVSMAVDMEIARRAAVFVGNGVSVLLLD